MGELRDKRIVQSRIYIDPDVINDPGLDYDYSYPITVYDAVKQSMDDNAPSLTDELEAIYRLIRKKQDIIDPGIPGQLMTWTGIEGQIGAMEVVKGINVDPALRSHSKVVSERALGETIDKLVTKAEFNNHANNAEIHITDIERTRWNAMAPLSSLTAHLQNNVVHVSNEERARWNAKANQNDLDDHIFNLNNPHNVTAHQVGAYTRSEIDAMFENLRESFFNYLNIYWDDRDGSAKLVEYHPSNWNPNYVLKYGDPLPDVPDPTLMYFALIPVTDYEAEESTECLIYVKRPGLAWQEAGCQTMNMGDLVIRYPETIMYVWVQGRFRSIFSGTGGTGEEYDGSIWKPSVTEDGILSWALSKDKTAPDPVVIKGKDGYTPIKGVDYNDGENGVGVPVGGVSGDLLIKLSNENYDTTWKSFMDILNDLVLAGLVFPNGLVKWASIDGRPEWYDELGENSDGFITQRAATHQFSVLSANITDIQAQLQNLNELKDDFYDHINDFTNPHKVSPAQIGAVTVAAFTDHVQNFNNPHNVTPDQLGLGLVDNTPDLEKPISQATQNALDDILDLIEQLQHGVDGLNYISNVTWDDEQVLLRFIYKDATVVDVHIPIIEIFNSLRYDKVEKDLVLELPNGTEKRVDVSEMLITYIGGTTDNIQVTVEDDQVIKAGIIPGTVGENELQISVHLPGSPTTKTQPVNDRSTRLATTEFVKGIVIDNLISYETDRPLSANMGRILDAKKANVDDVIKMINDYSGTVVIDSLDSTSTVAALSANMGRELDLAKAPRVHTSPSGSTFGRATVSLFGHSRASDVDPEMDGTVFRGTDDGYFARGDHRHPTDITRAPINWPDVEHDQYKMTGEPKADTPPDASNDERVATTEWVRRNAVGVSKGYCTTASTTATKVVELKSTFMDPVVFIRQIGSTVSVKFTHKDWSGDNETMMNVQDTGAAPIRYGDKKLINGMIGDNHEHLFTFDGTYWQLQNPVPGTGYLTITIGPGAAAAS